MTTHTDTNGNTFDTANMTEVFIGSGKLDQKNREKGFVVGFNTADTGKVAAWVQAGRRLRGLQVGKSFFDFGVSQRSKLFDTQEQATAWAYATAKERTAKL